MRSTCSPCLQQVDIDVVLQRVRAGDREAFAELMARYENVMYRRAYSILKNAEEAEDATQETFLRVYSKLETFKGDSAFSTWLTRVAINICLMKLRSKRSRPAVSLDELTDGDGSSLLALMDTSPDPEQHYTALELKRRLDEAVHRLPLTMREIVFDQIYNEASVREAAEKSGISIAAAKSRLYRARKMLQCALPDLNSPSRSSGSATKREM